MFRTAILRSSVAVARTTVVARPAAVRRITIASTQRASLIAPKAAWQQQQQQAVRCYAAAAGGLEKKDVYERIKGLLAGFDKVNDPSNITETAHFANDLGLDSLDTVEVVMAIEEEFSIEIPDKDADQIHSVEKAVEYILSQPDAN